MKATFATIACLALAGFLSAEATVTGNNTAVVIQKDKVESSTGWQLLCVPVNGLALSGATNAALDIDTILPPEVYDAGTKVYIDSSVAFTRAEATEEWLKGEGVTSKEVAPGTIFWIQKPGTDPSAALTAEASTSIVFCGQDRTADTRTRPEVGTLALMKNDSSSPLAIKDVVSNAQKGDEIMRVAGGKRNYKVYQRFSSEWKDPTDGSSAQTVTIAPGESFYYAASSVVAQ